MWRVVTVMVSLVVTGRSDSLTRRPTAARHPEGAPHIDGPPAPPHPPEGLPSPLPVVAGASPHC